MFLKANKSTIRIGKVKIPHVFNLIYFLIIFNSCDLLDCLYFGEEGKQDEMNIGLSQGQPNTITNKTKVLKINRSEKESTPGLIIGRKVLINSNNKIEFEINNNKYCYLPERKCVCVLGKSGYTDKMEQDFEKYCKQNNYEIKETTSIYLEEGCFPIFDNDITIDIEGEKHEEENPHIQGNCWDIGTINSLKKYLGGDESNLKNKFKFILFERVGIMPLEWGEYLRSYLQFEDPYFLNYNTNQNYLNYLNITSRGNPRNFLKNNYSTNIPCWNNNFYPKVKKAKLNILLEPYNKVKPNPEMVYMVLPEYFKPGLTLESINLKKIKEPENKILEEYYKLLAPGGKLIFLSSSGRINRHGGCIFNYKKREYSPFKDLNDPKLKEIYQFIFLKAGFNKVEFVYDPIFKEDVLGLIAYK